LRVPRKRAGPARLPGFGLDQAIARQLSGFLFRRAAPDDPGEPIQKRQSNGSGPTDVIKFRQRYGRDSAGPFFDMDAIRWRTSIACLADELEYLKTKPEHLIVVDLAKACFVEGRELDARGKLRAAWKSDQEDARLEKTVTMIEQALNLKDHCVCHWRNPEFRTQIERALKATPPHDPDQYLPGLI
jgi:hypothetical protein